ncbi:hypothetical protein AB1N83_000904 [Pleurotus pulmonarius]
MSNIPIDIERLCVQAAISEFVFAQPTLPVNQIPAISRVCRRFKEWCYPILYRSITFSSNDASTGLPLLRRTLIESPKLALLFSALVELAQSVIVQWNENRKVALVNRYSELRVGKLRDQRSLKGLIFVDMINMSAIELRMDEAQLSQKCMSYLVDEREIHTIKQSKPGAAGERSIPRSSRGLKL